MYLAIVFFIGHSVVAPDQSVMRPPGWQVA